MSFHLRSLVVSWAQFLTANLKLPEHHYAGYAVQTFAGAARRSELELVLKIALRIFDPEKEREKERERDLTNPGIRKAIQHAPYILDMGSANVSFYTGLQSHGSNQRLEVCVATS